ncbi:TPA: hypothetical protein ACG3O8_002435 [Clostridioides difficile]
MVYKGNTIDAYAQGISSIILTMWYVKRGIDAIKNLGGTGLY